VPSSPAQLAVEEKEECAKCRTDHQYDSGTITTQPKPRATQRAPASQKNFANHGEGCARDANDACRRHQDAMQSGPDLRGPAFSATPVNKSDERHQEERLGVSGDKKECGGMSQ